VRCCVSAADATGTAAIANRVNMTDPTSAVCATIRDIADRLPARRSELRGW
jgi:hypothetical protein